MKVTFEDLENKNATVEYHRIGETTTVVCSLTLPSGFVVTGKAACLNPAEFDEQVGCELAYQEAMNALWELEAYRVKENAYLEEREVVNG